MEFVGPRSNGCPMPPELGNYRKVACVPVTPFVGHASFWRSDFFSHLHASLHPQQASSSVCVSVQMLIFQAKETGLQPGFKYWDWRGHPSYILPGCSIGWEPYSWMLYHHVILFMWGIASLCILWSQYMFLCCNRHIPVCQEFNWRIKCEIYIEYCTMVYELIQWDWNWSPQSASEMLL